jgi:hypothetical protein
MKNLINSILAFAIIGIIAMGFSTKPSDNHRILIQSTESGITQADLSQAAAVIINRFNSFSAGKFEINVIPAKNQIQLTLSNSWDLKIAEQRAVQKGELQFFETYNYKEVSEMLKGDSILRSLFKGKASGELSSEIGCTSPENTASIDQYLNSAVLNKSCKFAWNNLFSDPEACLYALKTTENNEILLNGSDIESFKIAHDAKRNQDDLNLSFRKSAIPLWAGITKQNIGRAIAIVLDGKVVSAPIVWDEIPGGNCSISGSFTSSQLKIIVAMGANGQLPASFRVVK